MERKISLIVVLSVFFCCRLLAQDIIVTKDAQKIEAKILEISKSEIKYKKQSNLEGPTFVVSTAELNSIIYANGEVQLFNVPANLNNPETIQTEQDPNEEVLVLTEENANFIATIVEENQENGNHENDNHNSNVIAFKALDWHGEVLPKIYFSKVEIPGTNHKRRRFWGDGVMFKKKEYGLFLQLYCLDAYSKYRAHRSFTAATWTCFVFVSMVGAIPFAIVADKKLEDSLDIYNSSCVGNPAILLKY